MSKIKRYHRLRLPHQFCVACDAHCKKSLELLTTWKLDRLWKGCSPHSEMRTNLDELTMAKQLDCSSTRK